MHESLFVYTLIHKSYNIHKYTYNIHIDGGIKTKGVRFNAQQQRFQVDWTYNGRAAQVTKGALSEEHEAACKCCHLKFHAVAAAALDA